MKAGRKRVSALASIGRVEFPIAVYGKQWQSIIRSCVHPNNIESDSYDQSINQLNSDHRPSHA